MVGWHREFEWGPWQGSFYYTTIPATGGIPTTASSIRGIQVKDGIQDNKNDEGEILWEVLRHILGD